MIKKNLKAIAEMINCKIINEKFNDIKVSGISIDSRDVKIGNLFIPIKGETFNGHSYVKMAVENGCAASLWDKKEANPPDNIPLIMVDDSSKALQDLAVAYRNTLKSKFVGISGSNGKTSTKDILAALLSVKFKTQKTQGNFNNELGVPLTILSIDEDCEVAVVEMGLEKKGDILFLKDMVKPSVAILTNVGTAHLENFNSVDEIANAKLEIAECIDDNGLFVYNGDDKLIKTEIQKISINKTLNIKKFGFDSSNDIYCEIVNQDENGISFKTHGDTEDIFNIDMLGRHQALNTISSVLVAKSFGLSNDEIKDGLNKIQKTGLRNEIVKLKACTILNDSYKSNPQSVLAALDTFETIRAAKKIAVLGDMLGLGENEASLHNEIGAKMSNYKVDELLTYGDLAKNIAFGAKEFVKDIKSFDNKNVLIEYLKQYLNQDCAMLIKASRSLEFDKVVDALKLI